jgi:hypothetical protein
VTSSAFPYRLSVVTDADGYRHHELDGVTIPRGSLLLLQLSDKTWIPGVYEWDQPGDELSFDVGRPPLFRLFLADSSQPRSSTSSHSVDFPLPADAALRLHPATRRILFPSRRRSR